MKIAIQESQGYVAARLLRQGLPGSQVYLGRFGYGECITITLPKQVTATWFLPVNFDFDAKAKNQSETSGTDNMGNKDSCTNGHCESSQGCSQEPESPVHSNRGLLLLVDKNCRIIQSNNKADTVEDIVKTLLSQPSVGYG